MKKSTASDLVPRGGKPADPLRLREALGREPRSAAGRPADAMSSLSRRAVQVAPPRRFGVAEPLPSDYYLG